MLFHRPGVIVGAVLTPIPRHNALFRGNHLDLRKTSKGLPATSHRSDIGLIMNTQLKSDPHGRPNCRVEHSDLRSHNERIAWQRLFSIWRHKRFILSLAAIALVLAVAVIPSMPRKYKAEALVQRRGDIVNAADNEPSRQRAIYDDRHPKALQAADGLDAPRASLKAVMSPQEGGHDDVVPDESVKQAVPNRTPGARRDSWFSDCHSRWLWWPASAWRFGAITGKPNASTVLFTTKRTCNSTEFKS